MFLWKCIVGGFIYCVCFVLENDWINWERMLINDSSIFDKGRLRLFIEVDKFVEKISLKKIFSSGNGG